MRAEKEPILSLCVSATARKASLGRSDEICFYTGWMTHLKSNSRLLPTRKMEGGKGVEDRYRLRVGDCRVVYEIQKERVVIFVVRVGHRKDVYRR